MLGSEARFVYDGWNLIEEITIAGNISGDIETNRYFVWGLDLSLSFQGAGGVGGLLAAIDGDDASPGTFLYCYDANGNVGQMIDAATGDMVARYEYDPFGNLTRSIGEMAEDNPFRFSTKYHDNETGLYYYGYRYYVPEIGRWINRDPYQENGGITLYCFVGNDGTNSFDMLGLWKATEDSSGKAKRVYEAESIEDTLETLSELVKLNYSEKGTWAKIERGTEEKPCKVSVPNTVVAYWAGDMGGFGKWWINWKNNINHFNSKGYLVKEYNGSSGTTGRHYERVLKSSANSLYGTYFWGHGNKKGLANSKDPHYLLVFSGLSFSYQMAFAHIYACESNSGKSDFNSIIWTGFTGTLYPLNPFDPDWDIPSDN